MSGVKKWTCERCGREQEPWRTRHFVGQETVCSACKSGQHAGLAERLRGMLEFDEAWISSPLQGTLFLIGGVRVSTADSGTYATIDGEVQPDYEYVRSGAVASGNSPEELERDATRFKETLGMTWEELFDRLEGKKGEEP